MRFKSTGSQHGLPVHETSDDTSVQPFDALAWLAMAAALVVVVSTFRDYGVPWDAEGEAKYGQLLLDYYASGFRDHAAFHFVNTRFYGGAFELPAAILSHISPFGVYATRHLFSALLGLAGIIATWRLARRLGGARAGALAAWLLALNPSWYGHAFINARDVPFGTGMMLCLLLSVRMLDELPHITWRTRLWFGLALGATISVRIGGVLALVFLLVPIGAWSLGRLSHGTAPREVARAALRIGAALLPALGVAYAVMAVLWPWAVQAPLNPLRALQMFSYFPFAENVLFEGQLVAANALPANYLLVQFLVRQPESLLIGLACAALLAGLSLHAVPWSAWLAGERLRLLAVVHAALFPFLYFILMRPVAYNGMRHFLFVVPPLTVLAALMFDRALGVPDRWLRGALGVGLTLLALAQTRALIALHPDAYVYFNSFAGGVREAEGRFELDFWGTSLAEAAHGLRAHLLNRAELPERDEEAFKVYVCGNLWSAALFFPPWLTAVTRIEDADFQLAIDNHFCTSPKGSVRLFEVRREGAALSYADDLRPLHLHPGQKLESPGDPRSVARALHDRASRRRQFDKYGPPARSRSEVRSR